MVVMQAQIQALLAEEAGGQVGREVGREEGKGGEVEVAKSQIFDGTSTKVEDSLQHASCILE